MPPGALSSLRWGAKGARRGPGHAGRGGVLGGLAGPTALRSCITAESGQLGPREGHVFMMGPRRSSASKPGLASTPTWIMSLPRVLVTPNNALLAPPLSSVWTSPVDAPPDAAQTRPPPGPQAGTRGPFLPGASPAFVSHDGTRRQVLRDKRDTRPPSSLSAPIACTRCAVIAQNEGFPPQTVAGAGVGAGGDPHASRALPDVALGCYWHLVGRSQAPDSARGGLPPPTRRSGASRQRRPAREACPAGRRPRLL